MAVFWSVKPLKSERNGTWNCGPGKIVEGVTHFRMSRCNFTCPPKNLEELKSHYTLRHFKAHFTEPQSAEKPPRIPVEVDPKKGLRCEMCTSKKKKEGTVGKEAVVYVKGSREDVVVHYAVEHDKLLNAMKKRATEREVIMAIGDLYGKGADAAKKIG